jgi:hypothetical protein
MSLGFSFPDEAGESARIQRELTDHFALATEIFRFWQNHDKQPHTERWEALEREKQPLFADENEIDPAGVVDVAMLLSNQAFRQFRSVLEDCSRCEAIGAMAVSRSLFETTLALWFVAKDDIKLETRTVIKEASTCPNCKQALTKREEKLTVFQGETILDRRIRANMYVLFPYLEKLRISNHLSSQPGKNELAKALVDDESPLDIRALAEKKIGPEWTAILSTKGSYSGLNVQALAKLIDPTLDYWYEAIYRLQSGTAHGTDAIRHFRRTPEGQRTCAVFSANREVSSALTTGMRIFLVNIAGLQNHFGFGDGMDEAILDFSKRIDELPGVD